MSELSEKLLRDYLEDSLKLIQELSSFIQGVAPDSSYWLEELGGKVDDFELKTRELLKEKTNNMADLLPRSIAP